MLRAALVALLVGLAFPAISRAASRTALDLNPGWKFIRQDVSGGQAIAADDAGWQAVALPHTWNNLDGEDGGGNFYQGPAWYRRHLDLSTEPAAGKSVYLKFDAASIAADVYVNGKSAGARHKGMFSAFCYDITPLLNLSGDNVIAVRVSNAHDADVPPLRADFTFYGGLYRGVHALILSPLCIDPLDDASSGVYLEQTHVTPQSADLRITTKLRNSAAAEVAATVTAEILDAGGKTAWTITSRQEVAAHGTADCVQHIAADRPHLWNARKDPYLYHARITVADSTGPADSVEQPLGFRSFSVDLDRGFILNGQSYPLHGVNRHQDRKDKGWAISPADHEQDFELIMEMGCTAVRLAHYEHAQGFYDLCDKGGLVAWAEDGLVDLVGPRPEFDMIAKQELRELIKQNYNHPAICFWSLFNELREPEKGTPPDAARADQEHQARLVSELNDLAHQLDSTRLTTAATLRAPEYRPLQSPDILAFNQYFGWYRGAPGDWPAYLDHLRAAAPGRAVGISEYGAGASIYEHEYSPRQPVATSGWHPEEWQCTVHEAAYAAMKDRPYLWGTFLWAMFDFGSDGRGEGDHLGINDKGLVTYDRAVKKDAFYFYKANWTTEPFVYITDKRFDPRDVPVGPMKIYSNCDAVELSLNGVSLGVKTARDHVFVWPDVTLARGPNLLSATGATGGKGCGDSCTVRFDPGYRVMRPVEPVKKGATTQR